VVRGGGTLPENKIKVANAFIDNPNGVPVRVKLTGMAGGTYSRGHVYQHPILEYHSDPTGYPSGCGARPKVVPGGACFTPGSTTEIVTTGAPTFTGAYKVSLGGTTISPCATCIPNEFEIPPGQTLAVWVMSGPLTFLQAGFVGDVMDNGPIGIDVAYTPDPLPATTGNFEETWVRCDPYGDGAGYTSCYTGWTKRREVHFLTRITVSPSVTVSVTARAASPTETLVTATGTGVTGLTYAASPWSTTETGY
jgi:hypothetical protein